MVSGGNALAVLWFRQRIYLQKVSVVGWGKCQQYVVQPVCGLLFVVLLIHQPTVEKSDVITYKHTFSTGF